MTQQINSAEESQKDHPQHAASRRTFLTRTLVAGATAVGAVTAAELLVNQKQQAHASNAWNEFMLSEKDAFREIMRDENTHVSFLKSALGHKARPKPTFKGLEQSHVSAFIDLAQVFENVGVGAYLLALPHIYSKEYLSAAGSIVTIEARHAGYLDALVGKPLSPNGAFDKPIPQSTVVKDVLPFISSLNGGPNPANMLSNDVDILNFALLLEYLEAQFYDLNVPKFF